MFAARLDDIQPSLRYCKYNVERSTAATSSDLRDLRRAAEGSDQLQAKLDQLLAEARKTQAETMSEVDWRGHGVPVRSEKVRVFRCPSPPARIICTASRRRGRGASR